ncbi:alpha/beta fold hydrolase [Solitalea sp. MAHUQ-68]|uniref:Alpha/beta fold hydrolase n=1 Tax=Solitalea agri TaxID=2953739 RepID=A0A9X2EZT3_9SPHI|nr:alpha/beta fold hydrolase [Solitalea agri]MCO4291454.1 alpha/beta fold hydrolase [Solitalea agri]
MKKTLFLIALVAVFFNHAWAQNNTIAGTWHGAVNVGIQLRIDFHISNEAGLLKATMDSPDQKAYGIEVDEINLKADTLKLKINRIGFTYSGIYSEDKQIIEGKFSQGGLVKELNLSRNESKEVAEKHFPQEPLPPFAYHSEAVSFTNSKDKVNLSGTFSRPQKEGKYPVVVLISGSGPQDRDENISGHKPFLVIADYLTKQGFAVLRFDDRGFGKSTGSFANSSLYNFAGDVVAGIDYLKTRTDVDAKKIILIGHSEGGYIAPMIASKSKDIALIVLLAGPGVKGVEVLQTQNRQILEANNIGKERIDAELQTIKESAEVLASSKDSLAKAMELKPIFERHWTKVSEVEKTAFPSEDAFVRSRIRVWLSPWFSAFVNFDPKPYLEKVKCPVLAMNGTKDIQVYYKENLEALKNALDKGGNKRCTFAAMEGLNHLFQTANKGTVDEYSTLEETFSPKALQLLGDWLKQEIIR